VVPYCKRKRETQLDVEYFLPLGTGEAARPQKGEKKVTFLGAVSPPREKKDKTTFLYSSWVRGTSLKKKEKRVRRPPFYKKKNRKGGRPAFTSRRRAGRREGFIRKTILKKKKGLVPYLEALRKKWA